MQIGALLPQIDFDNFFGVVPRPTGVGHKDGLEKAEESNANQVTDEEVRVEKWQRQRKTEHDDENIPHALLRIFSTDPNDFLAVLIGRCLGIQLHILLDIDDGAIGPGHDGLARSAGEPVDHRTAHNKAEDYFGLNNGKFSDHTAEFIFQQHDNAEHHCGGTDHRGADKHRLRRRLKGVTCAITFFELVFGILEVGLKPEVALNILLDIRVCFNLAQFENRLGIVRYRTIAVHSDGHRTHSQETERYQTESQNRRGKQEFLWHKRQERRVL